MDNDRLEEGVDKRRDPYWTVKYSYNKKNNYIGVFTCFENGLTANVSIFNKCLPA